METLKPYDGISPAPSNKERLMMIFSLVAKDSPAHDASEAHILLDNAFKEVELPLAAHPDIKEHLSVGDFFTMNEQSFEGKRFYYYLHKKDVLLLGDNGSIEVRTLDNDQPLENTIATHAFSNRPLVFEKVGADGRTLQEFLTS